MSGGESVVAFDLDGTLTVRDCVVPFLVRLGGWRGIAGALARTPRRTLKGLAGRDRDEIKKVVAGGVFRSRSVAEVAAEGEEFADRVVASWLRADVCQRLTWHQSEGHRAVVVSASLGPYVRPLAARLGIADVLCTDVVAHDGRYGDALDGGNCRGPEKARRLRAWLERIGLADATVWAYGDSPGDEAMLAMAAHPVMVRGASLSRAPRGALA